MWAFAAVILLVIVVVTAVAQRHSGHHQGSQGAGTNAWAAVLPSRAIALANHGNPASIQIVRSTTKPFEGCARPNWYGWTTSTGRQLAADELAWFIHHTPPGECPAYLYLFRDATQTHQSGYNAGALIYDGGGVDVNVGTFVSGPMYEFRTS